VDFTYCSESPSLTSIATAALNRAARTLVFEKFSSSSSSSSSAAAATAAAAAAAARCVHAHEGGRRETLNKIARETAR